MDPKAADILARMTDLSEEVVFIFNMNESVLEHLNPAFEFITYLERTTVLKDPGSLFSIIHQDDHAYLTDKIENIDSYKGPSTINFRILRDDGQVRWIRMNLYPVITKDNIRYLTGIGEDDTSRRSSLLTMEKVTAWKNASLEILTHDLREPMGTMKMLASIIARKLPDHPEVIKLTSMIEDIAQKNIYLIQSLLHKEMMTTEKEKIRTERLDVVWEVHQSILMYLEAQKSLKKNISFTYSHQKIYAELDSLKFLQVINNLVSNAIKFTGEQGTINIHVEKLEETFLLSVQDDGIGIPKRLQPYIFRKYTEAGRTGIDGQESMGLGMWIVKSLVEEHGGKVWFESEEGSGCTFYVEIPLTDSI